jgi:hypothetical protein
MIIQSQLIEDIQLGKTITSKNDLFYFSEEKYFCESSDNIDDDRIKLLKSTPTLEEINDFIEVKIFNYFRHFTTALSFLLNAASSALFISIESLH